MKSKEVLQLLKISRVTLSKYVTEGTIKVTKLDNGYYDYDKESVFKLMKKDVRINVIYSRVSTHKQKNDLKTQTKQLINYCKKNQIEYETIYEEIASGIELDRRQLNLLIDDVINYKIAKIYITYKDRLTRLSFSTIESIFKKFGTEIIVINELADKCSQDEIFDELISILHIYSTSKYSKRQNKKLT